MTEVRNKNNREQNNNDRLDKRLAFELSCCDAVKEKTLHYFMHKELKDAE